MHNFYRLDPGIDLPNLTVETDDENIGASSRITIQDGAPGFRVSNLGIDGTRSKQEFASELFFSLRLRPILMQISDSLQSRRDRRQWTWRERASGTQIEKYVPYGDCPSSPLTASSNEESP